jgi:hypothetical protein
MSVRFHYAQLICTSCIEGNRAKRGLQTVAQEKLVCVNVPMNHLAYGIGTK